jgi:hypothetical protein
MLVNEPLSGLENVQRGVFLALFEGLNTAIDKMQSWYDASDQEFATRTGRVYVPTIVEHVDPANFHEGHKPSLANSPIDGFPNISVMALRSNPSIEDAALDQLSSYSNAVFVEILIKSEKSEEETNRRIHRTVEAANFCLSNNPTLGGIASGLESVPGTDISEVFVKAERTSYGPEWFWQGARIEYTVRMQASPPPKSGILQTDSAPEYAIDQD